MKANPSWLPCCLLLLSGLSQGQEAVPGLQEWQEAILAHSRAENRLRGGQEEDRGASAAGNSAVPGLAAWQAQQLAVLEAENRLRTQDNTLTPTRASLDIPPSLATTTVELELTTRRVAASPVETEEEVAKLISSVTQDNKVLTAGFSAGLRNSISKLIDTIQAKKTELTTGAPLATLAATTEPRSRERSRVQELLNSHNNLETDGPSASSSFLDQLLESLNLVENRPAKESFRAKSLGRAGENAIDDSFLEALLAKKQPAVQEKRKRPTVSLADLFRQLNEESDQSNGVAASSIFDDSAEEELNTEDQLVGNFIQGELNSAARESEQLALDLDRLLEELEDEKKQELQFLSETFQMINQKLKGASIKTLKKDPEFVKGVFHRFAILGIPLREEDISITALQEARKLVTHNLERVAAETRRIATELRTQLQSGSLSVDSGEPLINIAESRSQLEQILNLI